MPLQIFFKGIEKFSSIFLLYCMQFLLPLQKIRMKDASLSLMAGGKSFADAKSEDFFVGDEFSEEYK